MPIYEYRCNDCGHTFDVIQKVSDPPITACTKCSGPTNKVISPAGLMFKGSGWYITDYSSRGKESGKDKEGDKKEVSSGAKKSETTP